MAMRASCRENLMKRNNDDDDIKACSDHRSNISWSRLISSQLVWSDLISSRSDYSDWSPMKWGQTRQADMRRDEEMLTLYIWTGGCKSEWVSERVSSMKYLMMSTCPFLAARWRQVVRSLSRLSSRGDPSISDSTDGESSNSSTTCITPSRDSIIIIIIIKF